MSLKNKYGPFTPQELVPSVDWLEKNDIIFELSRDQDPENQFKRNDPTNILAVTEFRTEVYLAQIFYLDVEFQTLQKQQEFEKKFIQKTEVIPIWINKLTTKLDVDASAGAQAVANARRKRFWASVLIMLWFGYIVFSYIRD